jgi:hypothetical protein
MVRLRNEIWAQNLQQINQALPASFWNNSIVQILLRTLLWHGFLRKEHLSPFCSYIFVSKAKLQILLAALFCRSDSSKDICDPPSLLSSCGNSKQLPEWRFLFFQVQSFHNDGLLFWLLILKLPYIQNYCFFLFCPSSGILEIRK